MDNASPRRLEILNEKLSVRHRLSHYELLDGEAPEVFRRTKIIAIALGFPPCLVLKKLLTLDVDLRETNFKLIRKLSSCWLTYIVPRATIQAAGEEKAGLTSPGPQML